MKNSQTNITLIGMSGCGKSFIGEKLAKRLNYKFLDTDKIIQKKIKLTLQQMIDRFGDDKLLKIEEKTILELGKLNNYVISPGGSVIYSIKAMNFLKKNSIIVFLNTSFKIINNPVLGQNRRGVIKLKKKGLKALFKERQPFYKKYADVTVNISKDFDTDIIIEEIAYNNEMLLNLGQKK